MHAPQKHIAISRHSRLFELLRQENLARAARQRINRPTVTNDHVQETFCARAETSFEKKAAAV